MASQADVGIGERLAKIRRRRGMTQDRLAERAEVSVDVIRKLEQGQRHSALMSTLTKLARALDVSVSYLLDQPTTLEATEGDGASLLAVRDALTSLEDFPGLSSESAEGESPSIADLRRAVQHAERVRQHGTFTELGGMIPGLVREARLATREVSVDEQAVAFGLLSEVYQIAATMMTALGREDLGYIGLMRAQETARLSGNELLEAMNTSWLSWVLFKQGRLNEAERVAVVTAETIEPDFVRDSLQRLAVWGILMLRAASAAVRNGKTGRAEECLSLARAAAARIGSDHNIYATPFGPTNAAIASVNAAVELGEHGKALRLASHVPAQGWVTSTWKARYLIDLAIAQSESNREEAAVDSLLEAESIAPEWMRYHTLARDTVRELAERESRRKSRVRLLADRLDIEV